jgi:hypothetical protein
MRVLNTTRGLPFSRIGVIGNQYTEKNGVKQTWSFISLLLAACEGVEAMRPGGQLACPIYRDWWQEP